MSEFQPLSRKKLGCAAGVKGWGSMSSSMSGSENKLHVRVGKGRLNVRFPAAQQKEKCCHVTTW